MFWGWGELVGGSPRDRDPWALGCGVEWGEVGSEMGRFGSSPPPLRGGFVLQCSFHGLRDVLATSLHPWLQACALSGRGGWGGKGGRVNVRNKGRKGEGRGK